MSWTTMDIGTSIKDAIYDVGKQNRMVLESIAKSQHEMTKSQHEMTKSQHEMAGDIHEMAGDIHEMAESLHESAKSQNEIKTILQNKD